MNVQHVERDLDAYVDRALEFDAETAVRQHLGECSVCRDRVAAREVLARLVRSTEYVTAPERLRARVARRARRAAVARRLGTWAAAAALVLASASGIALWRTRTLQSGTRQATAVDVVNAHVRSLMADHLYDVQSTDQHTVKPWFLGRLEFSPPVVDLASDGFPLTGGRLDYVSGHPVAALVYQRRQHTINVFVSPASGTATQDDSQSIRGFHARHWVRDGMSFWAVSDLNDAELDAFVTKLRSSR